MKVTKIFVIFVIYICYCGTATVHVRSPNINSEQRIHQSATYVHYGPRKFFLNGTSKFISSFTLCDPNGLGDMNVQDMIVVTDRIDPGRGSCIVGQVYKRLMKAGAAGFINIEILPAGIFSYSAHDWDTCIEDHNMRMMHNIMPIVSIYEPFGQTKSHQWENLNVQIMEPFDHKFEHLFSSLLWITVMRGVIPCFALLTSGLAFGVIMIRRYKKSSAGIVDLICIVEAPSNLFIGILLSLGQFGPMKMPLNVHLFFTTLFMGASVMSSVALALFLRGGARFVQSLRPQESVLVKHKFPLYTASFILLLADFLWIICTTIQTSQKGIDPFDLIFIFSYSIGFVIVCQLLACLYTFYQIFFFRRILVEFLQTGPDISPFRLKSIGTINRILVQIRGSGYLMVLSSCSQIIAIVMFTCYSQHLNSDHFGLYYFVFFVIIVGCRIGIAFTKILATCSNDISIPSPWCCLKRSSIVPLPVQTATPPVDTPPPLLSSSTNHLAASTTLSNNNGTILSSFVSSLTMSDKYYDDEEDEDSVETETGNSLVNALEQVYRGKTPSPNTSAFNGL